MDHQIAAYLIYIALAIPLTAWIGRILFKNGQIFLIDICRHDFELAESVNKLLLAGFYLFNIGYAFIAIQDIRYVSKVASMITSVGENIGRLLLLIAVLHTVILAVLFVLRYKTYQATGSENTSGNE